METRKKFLAFAMALVMTFSLLPTGVAAAEFDSGESMDAGEWITSGEDTDLFGDGEEIALDITDGEDVSEDGTPQMYYDEVTYINPLYADVMDESDLKKTEPDNGFAAGFAEEEPVYHATMEEAGAEIRGKMKTRTETIQIGYQTTSDYYQNMSKEIFSKALVHTGNPTEGDYLQWQYGGWKASIGYYDWDGINYFEINYTMTYYTTAAQEAQVDAKVAEVLNSLDISNKSDYAKICAIYDYLCKNITYDYDNLNDDTYKLKHTAYAALINGTSVCQGYAVLFYRMALEEGIDNRVITGIGNGGGHAWNIVKLQGKYYDLDSTWDAGRNSYSYFLKCDSNFDDHERDADYKTDAFYAAYPMGTSDYVLTPCTTHTWKISRTITEATCTREGEAEYVCTQCGETKTEKLPKTEHTWKTTPTVDVPATCQTDGSRSIHCSVCDAIKENSTETIPAGGHTWDTGVVTKQPTCAQTGVKTYTCTTCGETKTEILEKTDHSWDNGKITTEATCTAEGEKTYTCTVCGASKTESIAKTAHTPVKDEALAPTCTEAGKTEGSHCSVCGTVITAQQTIPATGHTIVKDEAVEATCTTEGKTEGSHCTVCGEVITAQQTIPATGHTIVKDEAVEATCTTEGKTEGSHCTVCGEVITAQQTVPAAGHSWDAGVITKQPTCTEAGEKATTCTVCGETQTETIPAAGHSWAAGVITKQPTCTETGVKTTTCTVCGETQTETIPAAGHSWDAGVITKQPTCTEAGVKTTTCTVCGETQTETLPAIGHSWDSGKVTKQPTCKAEGEKTYTCTVGGETKIEKVAKLSHSYATVVTKATPSKDGSTVTKCTICGDEKSSAVIPYPKTVTLSKTLYTYSGKACKPSVTVKGSDGRKISSSNYSVTYASGRKKVDNYNVKITFKGSQYTGSVTKTFQIRPKSTSISKKTPKSKGFKLTWKKQTSQTTGYQIQYSTSKKFTTKTTTSKLITKNKTTSYTASKLKANKTYYVRIRTYKTVKINGKSQKIYSAWSKITTVKTKK